MRVLVVDPWGRGSHRAWATGWADHSRHAVDVVGVPSTGWRWRLRAGAAPLAEAVGHLLAEGTSGPDVLVVGGMVDVAQLLGMTRRVLDPLVPVVVMQHESQLVHPTPDGRRDDEAILRNWSSWAVADRVWWNSTFHLEAVLDALPGWLASLPSVERGAPPSALVADLLARSEVVGVGVVDDRRVGPGSGGSPPVLVWPHRWEWDKDVEAFGRALRRLVADDVAFGVILAGDEPTVGASGRAALAAELGDRVVAGGPFGRSDYLDWLDRSDLVVSCARHEFFGVGVVEAMAAGCAPVVPDRLAYPEVAAGVGTPYPAGTFGAALRRALASPPTVERRRAIAGQVRERFGWRTVAAGLDDAVDRLVGGRATSDCGTHPQQRG